MSQRPNIEELLCDYLDGTLDAHHQRQIETLLKRHAKLRKVLAQLQQARGMLRDLPVEKLPAAASAELQAKLRQPAPTPSPAPAQEPAPEPATESVRASIPLYARPGLLRLAAALALALTGGLALWAILPSTSPTARRTVALDVAPTPPAAAPAPAMAEALARKDATDAAKLAEAETVDTGAAAEDGENEPAVMVVVADDIRGTQREIRDLLTSNNIHYESVTPPADVRAEPAKELQAPLMAKAAPTNLGGMAGPAPAAPAATPAPMSKGEAVSPAAQAPLAAAKAAPAMEEPNNRQAQANALAQQQTSAGAGAAPAAPSPDTMQAIARAVESARQANVAGRQQKPPGTEAQNAPGVYDVVVARNVTPDQLGRIRSGLRDASRSRNLRVMDAPVDRNSQMALRRDQAESRAQNDYPFQQQAQAQAQAPAQVQQDRWRQADQGLQQAMGPGPRRPISFSPRYDLTIVVQGGANVSNAATQANIPVWPVPATQPSSTLPSTAPVPH